MTTILSNIDSFRLETAIAHNHSDLFLMDARAKGGTVLEEGGLSWTYRPAEQCGDILFPKLIDGTAALNALVLSDAPGAQPGLLVTKSSSDTRSGCYAPGKGISTRMEAMLDGA